jgi:hypothetical protein
MPNACVHTHQSTSRGANLGTVQFFVLACDECGQDDVSRIIVQHIPTFWGHRFGGPRVEYGQSLECFA